jgi:hypothetical protein
MYCSLAVGERDVSIMAVADTLETGLYAFPVDNRAVGDYGWKQACMNLLWTIWL